MKRKSLVLPVVAGLLAPVLVACGGSDSSSDDGEAIVVGTTDQFTATKESPAPLDPAFAYDAGSWNILRQTLQTLMHVPRGGGAPVPEAASNCRFSDNQNESYRCELRDGLKFADGTEVTSEDVKFSIDRVIDINSEAGAVGLLANIDTIETPSDAEVIFHLKTPDATFPYKLSTPVAGIVSPESYEGKKLRDGFDLSGSGPYKFNAEVKDDKIVKAVFTKNDSYKGDLKLRNSKVELRSYADAAAMGKALDSGEIDVMARTMAPDQIEQMLAKPKDSVALTEMPGLEIRYLAFDTDEPVGKEKAVRQAVASLVDRGQIASEVYGSTAEPLYSLIPATVTSHTNSFFNKYGEPNRAEAEKLLEDAGVQTPVKFTMHYTTDHYGEATAKEFEMLKEQLNSSGLFQVDTKGAEWAKFRPAQTRGEYTVYGMGWFPDFPDPDNYIAPFLDTDNFLNAPYANQKVIKELIPQSRSEAERSAAAKAFSDMQDIVAEDVPVLPLWQGKQYVAAADDISGVEWALNPSGELLLWELGTGSAV
ncbi:ABC transporter substrate-binding protein [Streptomyces sp. NBC_01716]|uniref:ABC transporter substrate-binding protein n=1 Tax=Streptomyces sp. NBC_01716 TaxID=2975917 RepID=UPI002E35AB94|nr:ABC transporter substrate-binding protein [Streptomyces sp. NBC_01716]